MRLLAKTTTYGIMHMGVAFAAGLIVTGDLHIAAGIALLEPCLQIAFFAAHEHIWEKLRPGSAKENPNICCAESSVASRVVQFFARKSA